MNYIMAQLIEVFDLLRDCLQILPLISSEFKQINELLFHLKIIRKPHVF